MQSAGIGLNFLKFLKVEVFQRCRQINRLMFNKYLLLTNVGISASLSCAGDIIQQHYNIVNTGQNTWDKARTFRMTVSGVAIGVVCHYWYGFLDRKYPGRALKTVIKKVVIDQLVCSPVYITIFFATTCYMEERKLEEFKQELMQKWWRLYLAEWVIWPPAQVVNFYFLPPRYRVLYDNTISLGYDVYTSYVKHEIPLNEDEENRGDPS